MDTKLTKENLEGIKVEESVSHKDGQENPNKDKEGQEEIELNKQMEQTMKILTDSNLNLEDITTKED